MENGKTKVWLPTVRTGTGSDVYTIRLARALEMKGLIAEITWFALHHEIFPYLLRKKSAPGGTDIVFANSWNGFAFKRPGIPLVVTSHHPEFIAQGSHLNLAQYIYHKVLIRRYETLSLDAADIIVTPSRYTADSLNGTRFAKKVEVIHNWLEIEKFQPDDRPFTLHKPFRLLFVGTQSFRKGADLLSPIMRKLGSNFHLEIVGSMATGKIGAHPDNISFLGRLNDDALLTAYRECDALLFPSRWEGFGYTALEAMACGKPVITSDVSALPEVVVDGKTGILCEPGNVEAFVTACQRLAAEFTLAQSMGIAGRERALEHFSEQKLIISYVNLIMKLVAPQRSERFPKNT